MGQISGYAFRDREFPIGQQGGGSETLPEANGLTVRLYTAEGVEQAAATTGTGYNGAGYFVFPQACLLGLPGRRGVAWRVRTDDAYQPVAVGESAAGAGKGLLFRLHAAPRSTVLRRFSTTPTATATIMRRFTARVVCDAESCPTAGRPGGHANISAPDGQFYFGAILTGEYVLQLAASGQQAQQTQPIALLTVEHPSAHVDFPFAAQRRPQAGGSGMDLDGQPDPEEQRLGGLVVQRSSNGCAGSFQATDLGITNSSGIALFLRPHPLFGCARVHQDTLPPRTLSRQPGRRADAGVWGHGLGCP